MSCYDNCEREGREAYRRDRYSYETQERLDNGRYFGNECDREFADGFEAEKRAEYRRQEEQEERDAEQRAQASRQREYEQYEEEPQEPEEA